MFPLKGTNVRYKIILWVNLAMSLPADAEDKTQRSASATSAPFKGAGRLTPKDYISFPIKRN